MNPRDETEFKMIQNFIGILDEYDYQVVAAIVAHLHHFKEVWCNSRHDGELSGGYCFEAYKDVNGPYRLGQIRVGPDHAYRALAMFLDGYPEAYWVYLFKKVRNKQQSDMNRGRILAQQFWLTLKEKQQ